MRVISIVLLLAACAPTPADLPNTESAAPRVAALTTPKATLEFLSGWVQVQHGALVRGGHVDVSYNRSRLSACPSPTVIAAARFLPGGQVYASDEALSFDVPLDATSVGLWFHALAPGCEQWDSDYGRNWQFPVVAAAMSTLP